MEKGAEIRGRTGTAVAPWIPAMGYLLFFAILFFPMARDGRLPGNTDTWLNGLALPNAMLARLGALLGGAAAGTSFYPETAIFGFGESAFGTSAIFILFKLITGADVAAYYLFTVTLLALNGLGVFLLARLYVTDGAAAAFSGLAFAASNYTLGNLDSPHTNFFFVAFLALERLVRYLRGGPRRDLMLAAVLCGAQVWFSAYVFLFTVMTAAALIGVSFLRRGRELRIDAKSLAVAAALFLALSAPFFAWYAASRADTNFSNPWELTFLAEVHSLEPGDLLRTLENNILYPLDRTITAAEIGRTTHAMIEAGALRLEDLTTDDAVTVMGTLSHPDDVKYFVYTRRCAFLGLALYVLAAVGLASSRRWELLWLYTGSLILALGPFLIVAGTLIPNVTWPAYRWLPLAGVLRVPSRAFSFAVLAVCLAAALGLQRLMAVPALRTAAARTVVPALIAAVVLVENVPSPLRSFQGTSLATPEPLVTELFAGETGKVLLDLPSRPGGALFRDSQDLFEWNRELIYMNRQSYHRQPILNGVHGYFPGSRLEAQRLINALPSKDAMTGLREVGVDFLVYHHTLELPWEEGLFERLSGSEALVVAASSPEVTIFRWADGS